ncbi:MAG: hypothetical protein JW778_01515 [Candidatus Altiarchaeota archaeon]|nr:hypothetical protein [Candidatus Altiarchaeota archaeon]
MISLFLDRVLELDFLGKLYGGGEAGFIVIYGRRRIAQKLREIWRWFFGLR